MTLEQMKSKVRKDVLAAIDRHLDSPDELYVRMQKLDGGEYSVEVIRPSHLVVTEDRRGSDHSRRL